MTVRKSIDKFIAFFRQQRLAIGQIKQLPIYRKILYLVQIDALSRAAFPHEKGHKKRVTKFLDECSNWCDKDRVSAVQLELSLKTNGTSSGPLFDLINNRITSWIEGTLIKPSHDLNLEEVQSLAYSDLSNSDLSKIADEARYVKLFYKYRNALIHEFREPPDFGIDSTAPYYLGMGDHQSTEESSWKLVFPVEFLERLCERSIDGLEKYLIENNQDPYESYERGPR